MTCLMKIIDMHFWWHFMKNLYFVCGVIAVSALYLWGTNTTTTANLHNYAPVSGQDDANKTKREEGQAIKERQRKRWEDFKKEFGTRREELKKNKTAAAQKIKDENKKEWEDYREKYKSNKPKTTLPLAPVENFQTHHPNTTTASPQSASEQATPFKPISLNQLFHNTMYSPSFTAP